MESIAVGPDTGYPRPQMWSRLPGDLNSTMTLGGIDAT